MTTTRFDKTITCWSRASKYEVCRPSYRKSDLPATLKERLGPRHTIVRAVPTAEMRSTARDHLDLIKAIDGLFGCLDAYFEWKRPWRLPRRLYSRSRGVGAMVAEARAPRSTKRRQNFEKQLVAWCDEFGLLHAPSDTQERLRLRHSPEYWGYEGPELPQDDPDRQYEYVLEMMDGARLLALAVRRTVGAGYFGVPSDALVSVPREMYPITEAEMRLMAAAARLHWRDLDTGVWVAPSMWSLLCSAILSADELGLEFRMCGAEDCHRVFVVTRANRVICSPRCRKRMWAQKRAREKQSA